MKTWQILILSILMPSLLVAQTTREFGQSSRDALPASYIKALIWNIHGGSADNFAQEYEYQSRNKHLILMQEVDLNDSLESTLLSSDLAYTHARSFISPISGNQKGIATACVSRAKNTRALRSPVSELGFTTPKAVMLQTFAIEGRQEELLVVNVHAINFVTNDLFRKHIEQITKAIAAHKGPVLAAGDFNTWNDSRLKNLDIEMNKLFLERLQLGTGRSEFPDIGRWFGVQFGGAFDQIYTRGLKIRFKEIHSDSTASDHKPIEIHFSIL